MPGTWLYSLKKCICLGFGEGYGFSTFAHDESKDAELHLHNLHPEEKHSIHLYSHSNARPQKVKLCLPGSLVGKKSQKFRKKRNRNLEQGWCHMMLYVSTEPSSTGTGKLCPCCGLGVCLHKTIQAWYRDKGNQARQEFSLGLGKHPMGRVISCGPGKDLIPYLYALFAISCRDAMAKGFFWWRMDYSCVVLRNAEISCASPPHGSA